MPKKMSTWKDIKRSYNQAEYRQSLKGRRLNKKKKKHNISYNLTHSQFVRDKTRMANNHPSTRGRQMKTTK